MNACWMIFTVYVKEENKVKLLMKNSEHSLVLELN